MAIVKTVESVQQAALHLQPAARAKLTHDLVQSLASLPESEVAELWLAESEHRDAEMESGQVTGISGEEVFRRLYARYKRG